MKEKCDLCAKRKVCRKTPPLGKFCDECLKDLKIEGGV